MDRPAATRRGRLRAMTKVPQTDDAGAARRPPAAEGCRGFTLIELLLVVALIAIASGVASFALRDPEASQLDREAVRLVSLLEMARSVARGTGLAVHWLPGKVATDAAPGVNDPNAPSNDFRFVGLPNTVQMPTRWLAEGTSAEVVGARSVSLGPEPLIGAQRIVLRLGQRRLLLATDGLAPFAVAEEDAPGGGRQP